MELKNFQNIIFNFKVHPTPGRREGEDSDVFAGDDQVQGEEEKEEAEGSRFANCHYFLIILLSVYIYNTFNKHQ